MDNLLHKGTINTDPYYFVSYKREDTARVESILNKMEGLCYWYDNMIPYSANFEKEIFLRIKNCNAVLMFVSKNAFTEVENENSFVRKEFNYARKHGKKIIVIFLEEIDELSDIPESMESWYQDIRASQCIVPERYRTDEELINQINIAVGMEIPLSGAAGSSSPKSSTSSGAKAISFEAKAAPNTPHSPNLHFIDKRTGICLCLAGVLLIASLTAFHLSRADGNSRTPVSSEITSGAVSSEITSAETTSAETSSSDSVEASAASATVSTNSSANASSTASSEMNYLLTVSSTDFADWSELTAEEKENGAAFSVFGSKELKRDQITSIHIVNTDQSPDNCEGMLSWDISQKKLRSVMAYAVPDGTNMYSLYLVSDTPIKVKGDANFLFANFTNATCIEINGMLDTSQATSMYGLFERCYALQELDLTGLNTDKVTDFSCMFYYCSSLKNLNIKDLKTSNVTRMANMFDGCINLEALDVSGFDTAKTENMYAMFTGCDSLTALDLHSFNTSRVTTMDSMFSDCSSLTALDVSSFDTSGVTSMKSMFSSCMSLTDLDLHFFNTANVTDMQFMFYDCSSLASLNIDSFDTSGVTSMESMFYGCSDLTDLDLHSFNTANVTDMQFMFNKCCKLTALDLSIFNTSNVSTMYCMFLGCSALSSLDLSSFDTSAVTDMSYMFADSTGLKEINVSSFGTGNVSNMNYMFRNCSGLEKLDLRSFSINQDDTTALKGTRWDGQALEAKVYE